MVSKKIWEKKILEFVDLVKQVDKKKSIEVLGVSFQVLPGVFSPIYSSDTAWFAEKLIHLTKGKKFLEIGSGSGIIACLASISQASQVVATDINSKAVENIELNSRLHSLNISARHGSIFDPIGKDELFDIIFWNHPFYCSDSESPENDMITASVCDYKYQFLKRFFREGGKYLNKNGRLILGSSNIARVNLIKRMAKDEGYKLAFYVKTEVPVYKGENVKMDLRIYSFRADV